MNTNNTKVMIFLPQAAGLWICPPLKIRCLKKPMQCRERIVLEQHRGPVLPLLRLGSPCQQTFIVQLLFLNFSDFLSGLGPKNLPTWRHSSYLSGAGSHTNSVIPQTFDFIMMCQTVHIPVGVMWRMPSLCIRSSLKNTAIPSTDM